MFSNSMSTIPLEQLIDSWPSAPWVFAKVSFVADNHGLLLLLSLIAVVFYGGRWMSDHGFKQLTWFR